MNPLPGQRPGSYPTCNMFFLKFTGVIRRKWLAPLAFALALAGCGEQDLSALSCGIAASPDSHEPDDDLTQAMAAPPLLEGALFSGTADSYFARDYFEIDLTGAEVTIDLSFDRNAGDLDLYLFTENGSSSVASSTNDSTDMGDPDNEQIVYTPEPADAGTHYILVRLFGCPMNQPLPLYYDLEFVEG